MKYEETKNKYSNEELIKGLDETSVPLNVSGRLYLESTNQLCTKIEDMIGNVLGISEIDHVAMQPEIDRRTGALRLIKMVAYFNSKEPGSDFNRGSNGGGNGQSGTIMEYVKTRTSSGQFVLSDKFKKVMGSLILPVDEDRPDRIIVRVAQGYPHVGTIELDVFKVMETLLGITSNAPYAFNLLAATPANSDNTDFNLLFSKNIFTKNKGNRNRSINYEDLDARAFNRNRGGNNYNNNNNSNGNNSNDNDGGQSRREERSERWNTGNNSNNNNRNSSGRSY